MGERYLNSERVNILKGTIFHEVPAIYIANNPAISSLAVDYSYRTLRVSSLDGKFPTAVTSNPKVTASWMQWAWRYNSMHFQPRQ